MLSRQQKKGARYGAPLVQQLCECSELFLGEALTGQCQTGNAAAQQQQG